MHDQRLRRIDVAGRDVSRLSLFVTFGLRCGTSRRHGAAHQSRSVVAGYRETVWLDLKLARLSRRSEWVVDERKDSPTTVYSDDWLPERGGFEPPRPFSIRWAEFGTSLAHYSAR